MMFTVFCILSCPSKLKYRCNHVFTKFNIYRWFFWLCELTMMPVLINLAWTGTCAFSSIRPAIKIDMATCTHFQGKETAWVYWAMMGSTVLGFAAAIFYNCVLIYLVRLSTISP